MEFSTVFLNEASQIPYASALMAFGRCAQVVEETKPDGGYGPQKQRCFVDLIFEGLDQLFHVHDVHFFASPSASSCPP